MLNKRLIAKIINGEEVVMTIDDNMLSCEFGSLDRGSLTDVVNWGIYANRGSISFTDDKGYFNRQKIVNPATFKNYIVKFYFSKIDEILVATFKVDDIKFDDETRICDIQLIAKISDFQKHPTIPYVFGSYDVFPFYTKNAEYLSGLSVTETNANYRIDYPSYGLKLGEDSNRLKETFIYCPYLPFGNMWDRITKICQSTMCRVIEDENGDPIITGERPNKTPIIVKPKNIISISNSDFVRVSNSSINLTNRIRREGTNVGRQSVEFVFNYDEYGKFLSVTGADSYELEDNVASVKYVLKLTNKTKRIPSIQRVSTYDVEFKNGNKGYFSSESWIGESPTFGNYEKISLNSSYQLVEDVGDYIRRLRSVSYSVEMDCFEDGSLQDEKKIIDENDMDFLEIESNDLVQTNSYYEDESQTQTPLGEYILEEVSRRYAKGRECFEIECLFNDYYDVNRNKVFDGNDLSIHFNKYDIIIPYVMKKGNIVPYRLNEDGTPKQFRIIGISYSYDGLLKQKLSVQEERYDTD